MKKRMLTLLMCFFALTFGLAGCGSEETTTDPETTPLKEQRKLKQRRIRI